MRKSSNETEDSTSLPVIHHRIRKGISLPETKAEEIVHEAGGIK